MREHKKFKDVAGNIGEVPESEFWDLFDVFVREAARRKSLGHQTGSGPLGETTGLWLMKFSVDTHVLRNEYEVDVITSSERWEMNRYKPLAGGPPSKNDVQSIRAMASGTIPRSFGPTSHFGANGLPF